MITCAQVRRRNVFSRPISFSTSIWYHRLEKVNEYRILMYFLFLFLIIMAGDLFPTTSSSIVSELVINKFSFHNSHWGIPIRLYTVDCSQTQFTLFMLFFLLSITVWCLTLLDVRLLLFVFWWTLILWICKIYSINY